MIELKITINDEGALNVQGPIDNKIQVYGMLELAKEAIHGYHESKKKKEIVPGDMSMIPPFPVGPRRLS